MPQNSLDLLKILAEVAPLTSQPCLYFLINSNDEVVHVGRAQNLCAQLLHHQLSGPDFTRFSYHSCEENELDKLEQQARLQVKPNPGKPVETQAKSNYLTKSLICLKHNITALAFERLRQEFDLKSVSRFGATKYYRQEDVEAWLKRFKGLVVRGRYILQARPNYVAIGISERTKQIQLFTKR